MINLGIKMRMLVFYFSSLNSYCIMLSPACETEELKRFHKISPDKTKIG